MMGQGDDHDSWRKKEGRIKGTGSTGRGVENSQRHLGARRPGRGRRAAAWWRRSERERGGNDDAASLLATVPSVPEPPWHNARGCAARRPHPATGQALARVASPGTHRRLTRRSLPAPLLAVLWLGIVPGPQRLFAGPCWRSARHRGPPENYALCCRGAPIACPEHPAVGGGSGERGGEGGWHTRVAAGDTRRGRVAGAQVHRVEGSAVIGGLAGGGAQHRKEIQIGTHQSVGRGN